MKEYPKIQTVFKRDHGQKRNPIILWHYSTEEIDFLKNSQWYFTEKVDGTNIRVMFEGGAVRFGGRTDNAQIPSGLVEYLRRTFDPMVGAVTEMFPDGVCIYGEGFGGRIQKAGPLYGPEEAFAIFDIKVGPWWLRRKDVEDVAKQLGVPVVPIIGVGTLDDMVEVVREGVRSRIGDLQAEGLVAKPRVELLDRGGRRIVTKLKTSDF
jgi:hypothetical protein